MKLSVIVPAYNEEQNLPKIVPKIFESLKRLKKKCNIDAEVVIVNDGSKDNTERVIKALQKKFKGIKYKYQENQGKTEAVKTGVKLASGDIILIQDADQEYDPADYCDLVKPIYKGKAEVVYGNRFGKKGNKWLPHSFLANKVLTFLTNLLSGAKVRDMETCYKVFKANIAKEIYAQIKAPRFGLEPEVTMRVAQQGHAILNVPISYNARTETEGKKINVNDFFEAIWTLFALKIFKRYVRMPIPADFITYTVIGAIAVSSDVLTFWLLYLLFRTPYVNLISYTLGTFVSFTLNATYNFKVNTQLAKRYIKFWSISVIGAIWSSFLISWLIANLGVSGVVAKILTLPLVLVYQYIFSKKFVYS